MEEGVGHLAFCESGPVAKPLTFYVMPSATIRCFFV